MSRQKYLLIKGAAGLGDRIMGAATGLLYARLTGRRPIVDWTDRYYSSDGSNVFGRYFDSPVVGGLDELPETASVAPEIWRGRLGDTVRAVRGPSPNPTTRAMWARTCVDLMRVDHPEDVLVMWSTRQRIEWLRPHLQGEHGELAHRHADTILKQVMETDMPPHREIADRVAAFRGERLQGPTVGVHVRYSDRRTRVGAIRRRLERLLAREHGLRVFVATDNSDIRDEFERSYGAVSAPHWYAKPGFPLHKGPDRDPFEVGVEALVDLYLLVGCDHLIGDRASNFSKVALMLTDAPRSQVTDVQPLKHRWPVPLTAAWRYTVPGPAAPLAIAAARRWTP